MENFARGVLDMVHGVSVWMDIQMEDEGEE